MRRDSYKIGITDSLADDVIMEKGKKKTSVVWHPATESPSKRRVLMAFTMRGLKKGQYLFKPVRFMSPQVIPAECAFKSEDGRKQLPVAWCYYDEAIKGITERMCKDAAACAWAWWTDDDK